MGISGYVAGGMDDALAEVLDRRLKEMLRQQQEQQSAAQLDLQREQLAGVNADRAARREGDLRTIALEELQHRDTMAQRATDRNVGSDAANVLNMPGMTSEAKANELQQSVLRNPNASSSPGMLKVIEGLTRVPPKQGRHIVNGAMVDDDGKVLYQAPEKPTAQPRPGTHVIDGNLVDDNGKVIYRGTPKATGNAMDPVKAKEVLGKVMEEATKLRNAPGLASLTGARIGNPDYALGVSQEPLAGTPAATAKTYYDSVKALLTMENLGLMKGVLSETDMKVLQSASTSLNTAMQDQAFVAELDNIIAKAKAGLGGQAPQAGGMAPAPSHGGGAGPRPRMRFDRSGKLIP